MSQEQTENETCCKPSNNSPEEIISKKIINVNVKENQTKVNFTRTKKIDENDDRLNSTNPKVTVKTYSKRIIRRTGPDGEVTEEIHEEGEPLSSYLMNPPDQKYNVDSKTVICGEAEFQTSLKEDIINESGATDTKELSYPTKVLINKDNYNSYPVGAIITKTMRHEQSESETHSQKTSGEMRTTFSKTKTQSVSGKGHMEVKSKDDADQNEPVINGDEEIKNKKLMCLKEDQPEIIEDEILVKTDTQCLSEPIESVNEAKDPDQGMPNRVQELLKTVDFGSFSEDLSIASQDLIKQGYVRILEIFQKFSKPLKKLSRKGQITFKLFALSDFLLITTPKSDIKLILLEFCKKSDVRASIYEQSDKRGGDLKSKTSEKANLLCGSRKHQKIVPEYSFVLEFSKKKMAFSSESLVCSVVTKEDRDQWISVLSST